MFVAMIWTSYGMWICTGLQLLRFYGVSMVITFKKCAGVYITWAGSHPDSVGSRLQYITKGILQGDLARALQDMHACLFPTSVGTASTWTQITPDICQMGLPCEHRTASAGFPLRYTIECTTVCLWVHPWQLQFPGRVTSEFHVVLVSSL